MKVHREWLHDETTVSLYDAVFFALSEADDLPAGLSISAHMSEGLMLHCGDRVFELELHEVK